MTIVHNANKQEGWCGAKTQESGGDFVIFIRTELNTPTIVFLKSTVMLDRVRKQSTITYIGRQNVKDITDTLSTTLCVLSLWGTPWNFHLFSSLIKLCSKGIPVHKKKRTHTSTHAHKQREIIYYVCLLQ